MPVAVGETFERYTIEAPIGRGGMGEVYRAVDTRLRRKVALKILRPERGNVDGVARLFREARSAAALTHPNTVAIHDVGEAEGIFYIVMELVSGSPLLAYVGDDRVPVARKIAWLVDVARALGAAHKAGVVHRDVKPSNVMVSDEGVVKVLDFGLAKTAGPVSFRTKQGHLVGTPRYMAPEQGAGAEVDARSDQYSFGVTAYELLAGRHPGGALLATPVPPLHEVAKDVPAEVGAVIARTMARSPDDRFGSMDDVAVALADAAAGKAPRIAMAVTQATAPSGRPTMPSTESSAVADTVRAPEPPAAPNPAAAPAGEARADRTLASPDDGPLPRPTGPSTLMSAGTKLSPGARGPKVEVEIVGAPPARRSAVLLVVGIAVLGIAAFAGSYLASKEMQGASASAPSLGGPTAPLMRSAHEPPPLPSPSARGAFARSANAADGERGSASGSASASASAPPPRPKASTDLNF